MRKANFWKVIKFTLLLLITTLVITPKNILVSQTEEDIDAMVDEILQSMTPEEKIGQLVMVYWSETNQLPSGLLELISTYKVGSVLISEVNFLNGNDSSAVNRVANLTNNLQQYNWENNKINTDNEQLFVPLFLAVDHEGDGARLTRIRDGMTPIPSQMAIGATWSTENAQIVGQIVGGELNAIGINMLLGPVVDVLDNVNNPQGNLDIRVFGGDPEWVGELGRAYIRGVHLGSQGEVVTVAKHFPGHGDSDRATDSEIAITGKPFNELQKVDLVPFIRVTEYDEDDLAGITDALMSSHIAIQATGNDPISLYYDTNLMEGGLDQLIKQVSEINEWHKNGFVVVDSLGVGAIRNLYRSGYDPVAIADQSFRAGNDLLILHSITPNDNVPRNSDQLQAEAFSQIKRVISFFTDNYQDPFYQHRIDEAARKIVRAKLLLYPDLRIDSILVDLSQVSQRTGTQQNIDLIKQIARQSAALIYPSNIANIPAPPTRNDNIVFIVHNFRVPSCLVCGEEWKRNITDSAISFLIDQRNFPEERINTIFYYREGNGPAGLSTFLYGTPDLPSAFSFQDPERFPLSDSENIQIRNLLANADWIIFLFAAGDCGPNSISQSNRCQLGLEEADTLDKFYWYDQYFSLEAKIAAIAFGAPPWRLDSTHVNNFDVYYGVFSQIEPFHQQAMCVLLRDCPTLGHSPVNVEAVNYFIEDQLAANPDQKIEIVVSDIPNQNSWYVGDKINLEIEQLTDMLGNPVLDAVPISWRGKYSNGSIVEPINFQPWSLHSNGGASFELEQSGEFEITALVENLPPASIYIEVLPNFIETAIPTEPATVIDTPESPTNTPEIITQVPATDHPPAIPAISPTSSPPLTPTVLTSMGKSILGLIGILFLIGATIVILWRRKKSMFEEVTKIHRLNKNKTINDKKIQLFKALDKGYVESELRTICFELKIDYENLSGSGKSGKARELVLLLERENRLDELEYYIHHHRPHLLS